MTKEQEIVLNKYQGITDPRLENYLQNTERSVVQTISNWPLRIKEWADTQPGEINIRSNLKISRTIFLWLAAEVNDRKIINIEDLQNRPPQSTHHLDISHVIYPDRFRAFSFITWGFLLYKNSRSEIEDWDRFIAEVKSAGGNNKLVKLIHDPVAKIRVSSKSPQTEHSPIPTFNTEELAELSTINHYNLRTFIDEKRTNMLELKTFEKYYEDDLDANDTKIQALCFINGVRKKLLRYQMRVKVAEARKQGRQSLFVPEKVQIIFDPNRISLDNLLETAEFTEDFMKTRKINLLATFQQMEEINKRLGN